MTVEYRDLEGVLAIMAESHLWPNPANIYALPDESGFALLDLGCGGASGPDFLMNGLKHWGLDLGALHTVVLTHAHPDHMGALANVLERSGSRVLIHEQDKPQLMDPARLSLTFDIDLAVDMSRESPDPEKYVDFSLDGFFNIFGCPMSSGPAAETMAAGDEIVLGGAAYEVIHTPGHSPGHVSLFSRERSILFSGDLVGPSPAWYNPACGGVSAYLESLDKLSARPANLMPPSHGPVIDNPPEAVERIRSKLLRRENLLLGALEQGPMTFWELNQALFPAEHIQFFPGVGIVESHLQKLEQEGRAIRKDGLVYRA